MKIPDLIVINGDILTMDPLTPRVSALAVRDGRVTALGTDQEVRGLSGTETRIIDAGGRLVLPGFQDTHIHLQDAGWAYSVNADLTTARTITDLQQQLGESASRDPDKPWVRGNGWFSGTFGAHNLNRLVLDEAVSDRPCYVLSSDAHSACINTLGCEMLGLFGQIPELSNGEFVVDADGVATGMVHEEASHWVRDRLPTITDAEYAAGVKFAQALCNRHGITGVVDALVTERHARVYQSLADAGELTLRVGATAWVQPEEETQAALARITALREAHREGMFRIHSAKFFLDGVMESRTGVMIEPYSDELGGNSTLMFTPQKIEEMFVAFDAARFQIHVHVIGDGAVRAALDGLEAAKNQNAAWPSLHQLAHNQFVDPSDIPRFGELGVVANIQALWARNDASVRDVGLPMAGPERGKWMYPFRSLIDAGAGYALSSDWGVSTLNPFAIMATAVTRQVPWDIDNSEPFLAEQRLTREESLAGYTIHAAASAWRSQTTGSLTPGKYADLIILDRDILTCDVREIVHTEVLLTLVEGKEMHRSAAFAG